MKKMILFAISVVLIAIVMTACGGGGEEAAPAEGGGNGQTTLEVIMNDIYYGTEGDNINNPVSWAVKSGDLVSVRAENNGVLEHNWAIVEAGVTLPDAINDPTAIADDILFDMGNVAGGDTFNKPFTAPAAGTYAVICTVAGHYPSMQGTLVVE